MALVTVQRSPSPSNDPDLETTEGTEEGESGRSPLRNRRSSRSTLQRLRKFFHTVRFITKLRPCLSESYFTVKGAALILPQSECARKTSKKSHGGDIQRDLQSMLYLLRHEDRLKVAVKLEPTHPEGYDRYIALVSSVGRQDTEESVILGIDCIDGAAIGLVLPIWATTKIELDGDGGFSINADDHQYLFKPVSVQAMWSALQSLQKAVNLAEEKIYLPSGLTHTWLSYYRSKIDMTALERISQWHIMDGVEVFLASKVPQLDSDDEALNIKMMISAKLKEIMMSVDLDVATSRSLRIATEEKMSMSMEKYKGFLDAEMMRIFGQMDSPSEILDFLYLGSEWNACNLEEIQNIGIGYILNVTKEIDNFFQGMLCYMNVRVYDSEEQELMKHWDKTYKFISKARKHGSKVLVHCKMGISRSASTVMAYLMKENQWSLEQAHKFVQEKRSCIRPNEGFMKQLETYEGILSASNHRHVFRSHSEQNLTEQPEPNPDEDGTFLGANLFETADWLHDQNMTEEEILSRLEHGKEHGSVDEDFRMEADLETGSRSTDSIEESFPDIPSPTPDQHEPSSSKKSSSRGEYHFSLVADGSVASSGEVAGLEGTQAQYLSDGSSCDDYIPDDKGRTIPVCVKVPLNVEPMDFEDMVTHQPNVPSQSRIKPDSSWIKPDFDCDDSVSLGAEQSNLNNEIVDIEKNPPLFTLDDEDNDTVEEQQCEKVTTEVAMTTSSPQLWTVTDNNNILQNVDCDKTNQNTVPYISVSQESASSKCVELGIKQYYAKEQIPWCPGTVQKIKGEISKSGIMPVGDKETSEASSVKIESEKMQVIKSEATAPTSVSTEEKEDPQLEIKTSHSCVELFALDSDSKKTVLRKRPRSAYEKEDIQFQHGLVRKALLEIEERHRLFSGEIDQKIFGSLKPIQRSSSLKEDRESPRSRRSERRKTCAPILSPPSTKPRAELDNTHPVFDAEEFRQEKTTADSNENKSSERAQEDGSQEQQGQTTSDEYEKNITLIKCGGEEVPLEKGKVKRHTLDFENRTDQEQRKRLSSECSISSTTSEDGPANTLSDSASAVPDLANQVQSTNVQSLCKVYAQHSPTESSASNLENIPINMVCDKPEYSTNGRVTDRWINALEEKSKAEDKHANKPGTSKAATSPTKERKEKSPFNAETLALIREIGSVLVNNPSKTPEYEADASESSSQVKMVVRNIEKQNVKKDKREIIIIEDSSNTAAKTKNGQTSSQEKYSSIVETTGSVFGPFAGKKHISKDSSESGESSVNEKKDLSKPSRSGLSLDLWFDHDGKGSSQTETSAIQSGAPPQVDREQQGAGDSQNISPRSESEQSVVKHLVGHFEKDVKSPSSERPEPISSKRRSASLGQSGTASVVESSSHEVSRSNKGIVKDDYTSAKSDAPGLHLKSEKCSGSDLNMQGSPRSTRPKSADHVYRKTHQGLLPQEQELASSYTKFSSDQPPTQPLITQPDPEASEDMTQEDGRKVRRLQGKSHPLTMLSPRLGAKPFYNTM